MEQYLNSFTALFDSRLSVKEASGQRKSIKDMLDLWGATENELINAEKRDFAYKTGIAEEGRSSEEIKTDLEFAYQDTEYYQNMLKQKEELEERQAAYNDVTENIKKVQNEIKATTDKARKKELQAELKTLKNEQKQLKLSSADKKNLDRLTKEIESYANSTKDSELYNNLVKQYTELEERQKQYDELQEEITAKKAEIAATTDKTQKKALQAELKTLNADAKKVKLTTLEAKNLKALKQQIEAMDDLSEQAIVDQATANTANYQELVGKIADLQAKKSAGKKIDETKLAMYLDELAAINKGVLSSSIASYIKIYEEW